MKNGGYGRTSVLKVPRVHLETTRTDFSRPPSLIRSSPRHTLKDALTRRISRRILHVCSIVASRSFKRSFAVFCFLRSGLHCVKRGAQASNRVGGAREHDKAYFHKDVFPKYHHEASAKKQQTGITLPAQSREAEPWKFDNGCTNKLK